MSLAEQLDQLWELYNECMEALDNARDELDKAIEKAREIRLELDRRWK